MKKGLKGVVLSLIFAILVMQVPSVAYSDFSTPLLDAYRNFLTGKATATSRETVGGEGAVKTKLFPLPPVQPSVEPILLSVTPNRLTNNQPYDVALVGTFVLPAVVLVNGVVYPVELMKTVDAQTLTIYIPQGARPGTYYLSIQDLNGISSPFPLVLSPASFIFPIAQQPTKPIQQTQPLPSPQPQPTPFSPQPFETPNPYIPPPQPLPQPCILQSAAWSHEERVAGENVILTITGTTACAGKKVYLSLKEKDLFKSDDLEELSAFFDERGLAKTQWRAQYYDDGFFEIGKHDAELFFVASLIEEEKQSGSLPLTGQATAARIRNDIFGIRASQDFTEENFGRTPSWVPEQSSGGNEVVSNLLIVTPATKMPPPQQQGQGGAAQPVGVNIGKIFDWNPNVLFTNLRMHARAFPATLLKNAKGWPLQAPAQSYLFKGVTNYPAGPYVVIASGDGDVSFSGDMVGTLSVSGTTNKITLPVIQTSNGIDITITRTNPSNPITFDIVPQQYEATYQTTDVFYPSFLQTLTGIDTLRFMDALGINGDPDDDWNKRTLKDSYTQGDATFGGTEPGIAYEYLFDLADTLQQKTGKIVNVWLNIPHKADDTYVQQLAQLVSQRLQPGQKLYLEYSNELWNGGFTQKADTEQMAVQAGLLTTAGWPGSVYYQAYRLAQILDIFVSVLGAESGQLIPVAATQSGNTGVIDAFFTIWSDARWNPQQHQIGAIATNPYCCHTIADDIYDNDEVNTITVADIISRAQAAVPLVGQNAAADRATAQQYGVAAIVAYEGGQHLVATGAGKNDPVLTQKLVAANRDPAMQQVIDQIFTEWFNNGGGVFNFYNHIDAYNQFGSWGVFEYTEQNPNTSPKYLAIQQRLGQTTQCAPGQTQPCALQQGVCQGSTEICTVTGTWNGCTDQTYASYAPEYENPEITCTDGIDNDCDGQVDSGPFCELILPAPRLDQIIPASIPFGPAATVSLIGDDFTPTTEVILNNLYPPAYPSTFMNKQQIDIDIPAGAPTGTYSFFVFNENGVSEQKSLNILYGTQQGNPPVLTGIIPNAITNDQQQVVVLTGSDFDLNANVRVNGQIYSFAQVQDSTKINMWVPQGTPVGQYTIDVENGDGQRSDPLTLIVTATSASGSFLLQGSLAPAGTLLSGQNQVKFANNVYSFAYIENGVTLTEYEVDLNDPDVQRGLLKIKETVTDIYPIFAGGTSYRDSNNNILTPLQLSQTATISLTKKQFSSNNVLSLEYTHDTGSETKVQYDFEIKGKTLIVHIFAVDPSNSALSNYEGVSLDRSEGTFNARHVQITYAETAPIIFAQNKNGDSVFYSLYPDWTKTNSNKVTNLVSQKISPSSYSAYYPTVYAPDQAGNIQPLDETLFIIVSDDPADAIMKVHNQPSSWRDDLNDRVVVDIWSLPGVSGLLPYTTVDTIFDRTETFMKKLHSYGLDNYLFLFHYWGTGGTHPGYNTNPKTQCWNENPKFYPASPFFGGDAGLLSLRGTIKTTGSLFGLFVDYADMYQGSPYWDISALARDENGNLQRTWSDPTCTKDALGLGPQPYSIAPDKMLQFSQQDYSLIESAYDPTAIYLDVSTKLPRGNQLIDFSSTNPNSRTIAQGIANMIKLNDAVRTTINGPLLGEGGGGETIDHFLASHTDGIEGDLGRNRKNTPAIPDFEVRHIVPLMANQGAGWQSRYEPGPYIISTSESAINIGKFPITVVVNGVTYTIPPFDFDRWRADTILYAHTGLISDLFFYGNPVWSDILAGRILPASLQAQTFVMDFENYAVKEYYYSRFLQNQYLSSSVVNILYNTPQNTLVPLGEAIELNVDFANSQVYEEFANGLKLYVNRHQTQVWQVDEGGISYYLPPNGWLAANPSVNFVQHSSLVDNAGNPSQNGHRVDYVRTPDYMMVDGRGVMTDFGYDYCGTSLNLPDFAVIKIGQWALAELPDESFLAGQLTPCSPTLSQIQPTQIDNSIANAVTITGSNFDKGSAVWLNDQPYSTNLITRNHDQLMTMITLQGMNPGVYALKIVNSDGSESQELPLTVTGQSSGGTPSSSGSSRGNRGSGGGGRNTNVLLLDLDQTAIHSITVPRLGKIYLLYGGKQYSINYFPNTQQSGNIIFAVSSGEDFELAPGQTNAFNLDAEENNDASLTYVSDQSLSVDFRIERIARSAPRGEDDRPMIRAETDIPPVLSRASEKEEKKSTDVLWIIRITSVLLIIVIALVFATLLKYRGKKKT